MLEPVGYRRQACTLLQVPAFTRNQSFFWCSCKYRKQGLIETLHQPQWRHPEKNLWRQIKTLILCSYWTTRDKLVVACCYSQKLLLLANSLRYWFNNAEHGNVCVLRGLLIITVVLCGRQLSNSALMWYLEISQYCCMLKKTNEWMNRNNRLNEYGLWMRYWLSPIKRFSSLYVTLECLCNLLIIC